MTHMWSKVLDVCFEAIVRKPDLDKWRVDIITVSKSMKRH